MFNNLLNKIHHADCMPFMASMPDKCVDMTLTDIPYGECDKISHGLRVIGKGEADRCDFDLVGFLSELKRITRQSIYIFCGIGQVSTLHKEMEKNMTARLCHWVKTNPSPMNGQYVWLSATENCVFGRFSKSTFNEFCKPNVWNFPSGTSALHPTQKPIGLFSYLIQVSSKKNDIIFDPCVGSGTSAIAAVGLQRNFIGVEKSLEWYNLSSNRIKQEINMDMFSSATHF